MWYCMATVPTGGWQKVARPVGGSLKCNTVLQLDRFCRKQGRWDHSHFVRCILEGLRQARSKPLNYGKLENIEEEEKEAPGKFLDRVREALCRYTEIDPESEEGKVTLKDRFLTQSAPDIRRKLSKWAYGPNQSLDNLLQLAQSIMEGNMRKRKKGRERQRNRQKPSQWLWKPFLNNLRKMPRGTQVKRDGLAITVERRGTSSRIALRHLSRPMSGLQRTTLEERLPPEA